jgi:hypothetical protein
MFVMGLTEDEYRLRETGVMLSIVLPVIGLLEDRIYRKSRERYLETKAAAERQKLGLPPVIYAPQAIAQASKLDPNAIDWYGLYG